jgi:hypothetical protein
LGDIAIEATTDCGTGINDKTEVRVYGTTPNEDRTDQIRIGPYTCKNLREPCPFLGIMYSNNMTGSCHHKIRQKKAVKASGRLNIAWAHNKGIPFWEEWQLWLAVGWSTLAYGSEIWPWGQNIWAEKADSFHMKQMLGVGQTTSYESMCWLTGILPARERVWIRAFKFAGRLTSNQVQGVHTYTNLELTAWQNQWTMWEWATDNGSLEITGEKRHNFWIYGMLSILREIGWRNHADHIALRHLNGNQFQDRCKDIIECIKQYGEGRLRDKLEKQANTDTWSANLENSGRTLGSGNCQDGREHQLLDFSYHNTDYW